MSDRTRPPMGWNSWDCYGTTVTEQEVLANARFMAEHLLPAGWDTIVIDAAWFDPIARAHGYNHDAPFTLDDRGRQLPTPNRFPSAAAGRGFAPLAQQIHDLGLRFGLHVMRGIPRLATARALPIPGTNATTRDIADPDDICTWNPDNYGFHLDHPAAQTWIDAQVQQFADWGVDYLKADDMLAPYDTRHIESFATAIRRSGRDITLSLSPGTALPLTVRDHVASHAHLWRISDDVWDLWDDVATQIDRLAAWAPDQGHPGWADADMLPLGRIGIRAERGDDRISRLTDAEQRTLFTLWCITRSPLMMGGDLPTSPAATIAMLTHPGLLHLHATVQSARQVLRTTAFSVWNIRDTDPTSTTHTAVFSLLAHPTTINLPDAALRDPTWTSVLATDVWTGTLVDNPNQLEIEPHGCRLLRLDRQG